MKLCNFCTGGFDQKIGRKKCHDIIDVGHQVLINEVGEHFYNQMPLYADIRECIKCKKKKIFPKSLSNSMICGDCLPNQENLHQRFIRSIEKAVEKELKNS